MIGPGAHDLFQELCRSARTIVVTTHIQPDGDAIGSQQSLTAFLQSEGKHVTVINRDPTPGTLRYLERPAAPVSCYDPGAHDAEIRAADLVVLVDNSAPDRLGSMERIVREVSERVLCIDHHPARDAPWRHNILDVESSATTAMIFELTRACGWTPDLAAAEAMYLGLATDTGFFRFNSTNARAHRVAAELIELGVEPARTYGAVYERNSVEYTRLLGHALAALRLEAQGALASVVMTRELIESLHAEKVDTSEITTALLAIDGVRVVALYRELGDARVKVSLRSKGDLDVHRLAGEFGGGGHRNASGIVMSGPLEAVVSRVGSRAVALLAGAASTLTDPS